MAGWEKGSIEAPGFNLERQMERYPETVIVKEAR
jgi:hypothetical protein